MGAHYSLLDGPAVSGGEPHGPSTGASSESDVGLPVFTVNFTNNSNNVGSVYWFQTDSGSNEQSAQSLAWIATGSNPGTGCRLQWSENYSMFWSSTSGGQFALTSSQYIDCTLTQQNQATLGHDQYGFSFSAQCQAPAEGMTIIEDQSIPDNTATVGIGMAGAGTFSVPAQPNLTVNFCPAPSYWIAFSLKQVEQGTPLGNPLPTAQSIVFPCNEYTCGATLNDDESWLISFSP